MSPKVMLSTQRRHVGLFWACIILAAHQTLSFSLGGSRSRSFGDRRTCKYSSEQDRRNIVTPWSTAQQQDETAPSESTTNPPSSSSTSSSGSNRSPVSNPADPRPCFYKVDNQYYARRNLADLKVGDKLLGRKIKQDNVSAKTGPKIFFECGVGRIDSKRRWQIANGMLRLGKWGSRASVTKKRIGRLSNKDVELYVSRIRLDSGQFEVTTSLELATEYADAAAATESASGTKLRPVSSLTLGQEVIGTVTRLEEYGAFIKVDGINRQGLLHIQKVADLYGHYIRKQDGLEEAGLEKGTRVRLQVLKQDKKRLELDFTNELKAESAAEKESSAEATMTQTEDEESLSSLVDETDVGDVDIVSEDEAAAWAAYAPDPYDEEEDDYDEDREIEDALGLDSY
eukprot:CAMPEP_0198288866 /NCGR_PEP_ID=MMETSP1449-20131203/7237_1 /TAXON_ID=420275 /ORGANISM="Attheya septentrionalis, Strain CCMP2084" /LENGTH=398 /DNA_ID=CAMNT_0043987089 /DNA_START=179 /DNA_END=1375 /DNA_ORIENTATION=+